MIINFYQNLLEILDDEEYYDINIKVGNDPYTKIFHAHIVILKITVLLKYLRRFLPTNKMKNDDIKLPNILPESFQITLVKEEINL